jgi:hypothetical protein
LSFDDSGALAGRNTTPPVPGHNAIRSFRLATAVIWTLLILVLCWTPAVFVQKVEGTSWWFRLPSLDKVVHAGIFVVLSILWLRLGRSKRMIWAVILGGFALGALTELGQLLPIVKRNAELYDLATDCVGVLVGVAIAPLVEPLIRIVERRLFREPTTDNVPVAPAAAKR